MRILASLLAWASALVLALLVTWPGLSSQPFPLPGYRGVAAGTALDMLAVAALALAVWVSVFWQHVRRHPWPFVLIALVCFLVGAVYVSVPVGLGFALISMLVRSK